MKSIKIFMLCAGLLLKHTLALAGPGVNSIDKAQEIISRGQATAIKNTAQGSEQPAVIEFFSFYCPPCYAFSNHYGIDKEISKILPPGQKLAKYHVDFLGPLGAHLTDAWVIAQVMGIEDKVEPLLFEAAQVTHTLKTPEDIKKIFEKVGITTERYNHMLKSILVRGKVAEQRSLFNKYQITGTPTIIVNGQYRMNNGGFSGNSIDKFRREYISSVAILLKSDEGKGNF